MAINLKSNSTKNLYLPAFILLATIVTAVHAQMPFELMKEAKGLAPAA
jgi:hypothetical protein